MSTAPAAEQTLYDEQVSIARESAVPLIAYIAVSSAVYSVVDAFYFDSDGLYFFTAFLVWGLGYVLLVKLMQASARYAEGPMGGIGGYFALGLVASIAIGVGLVVLIIPGLYLLMRWLPAYARYYAKADGVTEVLAWSWRETEERQMPLALALMGPIGLYCVTFGIIFWQEFAMEHWSDTAIYASIVALNLLASIAVAWMQLLGVAAYRVIELCNAEPVDVFE